jgi:hypothetical protein
MAGNSFGLTHSATHPRPQPLDKLKALSSIEGLGLKVTSIFDGGGKSAAQGQPLPTAGQAEQSNGLTKRVDYINFFC